MRKTPEHDKLCFRASKSDGADSLSRILPLCIVACIIPAALGAPPKQPTVEVRLTTHLTSYSGDGTPVRCVVIRQLESGGKIVIPRGSIISGHVRRAKPVGLGIIRERATIELAFAEYRTPDGRTFPLHAKLASIDNSRERVTRSGQIRGVIAANDPNRFIFGIWMRPSLHQFSRCLIGLTGASNQIWSKFEMGPIGAVALLALRYKMFPFAEPEIHLPPGTDMTLAVKIAAPTGMEAPIPAPHEVGPELAEWIRQEPFATERSDGRPAPDIVNVAFLGSEQDVQDAFTASGWYRADPGTIRNYSRMFGAFNSMREYASAPVSTLLYQDAPPALVFEKSLNNVAKRHHVRIWQAGVIDGEPVWLGAATHDTGIGFNFRGASFTHKIDKHIDFERTKITTDLVFAGCSETSGLVERQHVASSGKDALVTDGAVAVLDLQPCAPIADLDDSPGPLPSRNKFKQFTRRFVLETRNYIVRENLYYWGYRLIEHQHAQEDQ
jgi:hypothetical protein